jgi:hypothetical protein
VELDRRDAEPALQRAGRDVDELHPPVRHDDHPPEQPAPDDEQVVVPLGVAPGPVVPVDQAPGEGAQNQQHGEGRPDRGETRSGLPRDDGHQPGPHTQERQHREHQTGHGPP